MMQHFADLSDLTLVDERPSTASVIRQAKIRFDRSKFVTIHCDGACYPNPGPGGYGAVIDCPVAGRLELSGSVRRTTNNRMELSAAIVALSVLPRLCTVRVVSDSQYLVNGASVFAASRRRKLAEGKDVPNAELWLRLDDEKFRLFISWEWVRGHNGNTDNELADRLATRGLREALPAIGDCR